MHHLIVNLNGNMLSKLDCTCGLIYYSDNGYDLDRVKRKHIRENPEMSVTYFTDNAEIKATKKAHPYNRRIG